MSTPSYFRSRWRAKQKKNFSARYYPVIQNTNLSPFVQKTGTPSTDKSLDPVLITKITDPKADTTEQGRVIHSATYQTGKGDNKEESQVSPSSSESDPDVEVERLNQDEDVEFFDAPEEEQPETNVEAPNQDKVDPVSSSLKRSSSSDWSPWEPPTKKSTGFKVE